MKKPLADFNACDDFFELVVRCHLLVAAMEVLGMNDLDGEPSAEAIPNAEDVWTLSTDERKMILQSIVSKIIHCYTNISYNAESRVMLPGDGIHAYAKQLLTVGCLYLEMADGIREGDGDRVVRCWRYLLPIFVGVGRKNYALESLEYSLPPRQAE